MQIVANTLIRAKADEIFSRGAIYMHQLNMEDLAPAAICWFANEFDGKTFRLVEGGEAIPQLELADLPGGDKALVHYFRLVDEDRDGDVSRSDVEFAGRAVGRAIFYLEEESVKPLPGRGRDANLIWLDRGINENGEEMAAGYDMNRDGEIENTGGVPTLAMLKDNPAGIGVLQAPVDVGITFYSDSRRSSEVYSVTRRIVLSENKSSDFPGSVPDGGDSLEETYPL
jgi:hypothetical protein